MSRTSRPKFSIDPVDVNPVCSARVTPGGNIVFEYAEGKKDMAGLETAFEAPAASAIDPAMYRQFLKLEQGPAEEIVDFTRRFGPLVLTNSLPLEQPIDLYRKWAGRGNAISRAGIAVRHNDSIQPADLRLILKFLGKNWPEELFMQEKAKVEDQSPGDLVLKGGRGAPRGLIRLAINHWYSLCPQHNLVEIVGGQLYYAPRASSLFGAIIEQISAVVVGGRVAICSYCSREYTLKRQPRAGQRRYCPGCRRKRVPHRQAARDYRERGRQSEVTGNAR